MRIKSLMATLVASAAIPALALAAPSALRTDAAEGRFASEVSEAKAAMMSNPDVALSHAKSATALAKALPGDKAVIGEATGEWLQGEALSRLFHGARAVVTPLDSPGIRAAAKALEIAFGVPPVFIREGGSIPIVTDFKSQLGADSLLLGFGLSDDNTHAPNEKFSLKDFHRGIRTTAHLFAELAKTAV